MKGQGGPVFAEVDPSRLRQSERQEQGAAPTILERMIGVDLSRDHEIVILDSCEEPLAVTEFPVSAEAVSSMAACDNPNVVNRHEDVVLRFELNLSEPIDLDTFDFQPVAHDRHGGIFLNAIEYNGAIQEPIFHNV